MGGKYIGDGVYASHDGYQIWLAANDHRNKVVALERGVMLNLIDYAVSLGLVMPTDLDAAKERAAR